MTNILFKFFLLTLISIEFVEAQGLRGARQERNFTMPTLRVASILAPPFLQRSSDISARGNDRFEGFIKDMLDSASNSYGFRYRLQLKTDKTYGQKDPNTGVWSGLMGMLVNQRADMVAADLTVTSARSEVVDFTRPFLTFPLTILTKVETATWWPLELLSPFSFDLWLFFILAFLLTILIFALTWRISPYESWPLQWCDAPWYVASCCLRGAHFAPRALSTRLVAFFWGLFVVVLFVLYVLSLNNFLCVHHHDNNNGMNNYNNIGSNDGRYGINELLNNEEFVFGVVPDTASFVLLRDSSDPVHRAVFSRIESDPDSSLLSSQAEGMERLDADSGETNFGLIIEGGAAKYNMANRCDLRSIGELAQRNFALALPTGSPYLSLMDNAVEQMRRSGLLQRLEAKWFDSNDNEECDNNNKNNDFGGMDKNNECREGAYELNIYSIYGLFLVLLVALLVAFIISIIELVMSVYGKRGPNDRRTGAAKKREFMDKLKAALCPCVGKKKNGDMESNLGPWQRTSATQTELSANNE